MIEDASGLPMGLWHPGGINIRFDIAEESFCAFRCARFRSEANNIILDGASIHTVAGFADGSRSDFKTIPELTPLGSSHTLRIRIVERAGDDWARRFDALALELIRGDWWARGRRQPVADTRPS